MLDKVYLKWDPNSIDTESEAINAEFIRAFHNWSNPESSNKNKKLTVAIVDSGVDETHPIFEDVEVEHHNLTRKNNRSFDGIGHGCITPEAKVYTSQCGIQTIEETYKRSTGMKYELPDGTHIKDVSRQDIYTMSLDKNSGDMNRRKIEAVHKIPYQGKLHCIQTKNGIIKLTPWHPVYIRTSSRGAEETITTKRADQVKVGDMVCLSRFTEEGVSDSYLEIPYNSRGDKVKLNEDLGFLTGLIASDGHLRKKTNAIKFCNTNEQLISKFIHLSESIFSKTPSIQRRKDQPNYKEARFFSLEAMTVFTNIGIERGARSLTSRMPELITKSPTNVIWSFLAGLIEGDGSINKEGRVRIVLGSKDFAKDIVTLLNTLGVRASWCNHSTGGPNSIVKSENSYCVRLSSITPITERLLTKGKSNKCFTQTAQPSKASKVIETWLEDYNDFLYDFSVVEDHNYIADGHIVSNTAVAGLIVSHCRFVERIIDIRIFGGEGRTSGQALMDAYDLLLEKADEIDLANFSIGTSSKVDTIDSRHNQLNKKGIRTVVAAGNSGVDSSGSPASASSSFSVGALTKEGEMTDFSSSSPEYNTPNISALGQNIKVARAKGTSMGQVLDDEWTKVAGTSFACPITLAAVGNYIVENNSFNRNDFLTTADDIAETERDGHGILNLDDALKASKGEIEDESSSSNTQMGVQVYGDNNLIWLKKPWLPAGSYEVEVTDHKIKIID